jgi:hypothetical protein
MTNLDIVYDQVFIIDALPEDEYNKFTISQELMQFLADCGIEQMTSICRNRQLIIATLEHLTKLAKDGTKFCLHIVSHGSEKGLWIKSTDEEFLWSEFRSFLNRINQSMGGTLTVNMTSCFGLHGIKIVDEKLKSHPFFGLIGYSEELDVNLGKDINHRFYKKLADGKQVPQVIDEIKNELNDNKLFCISSQGYETIRNTLSKHK